MAPETYLTVEEAVLSRKIFNVVYHTREAKIHDKKIIALTSREAVNHGSREDKMTLGLKYTLTKESKWDSSVFMMFGVRTTIEAVFSCRNLDFGTTVARSFLFDK